MRMAKSIANERISYKVIPQSLPKIKFWQNQLSSGAAAIESVTSKYHYNNIYLLFCIGICKNVTVSVFFYKCVWNFGIQNLVEYKDVKQSGEKNERQKIDWRTSLATDEQRKVPHSNNIMLKDFEKIFRVFGCSSVVWTIFIFQFIPYETEIYQLIYFSEQMILWNQFVI